MIEIDGGQICLEQGWTHGPRNDVGRRWETAEVGAALRALIAEARRARAGVRRLTHTPPRLPGSVPLT